MMNDSVCVSCGRYVPEGRMICSLCEAEFEDKETLPKKSGTIKLAEVIPQYRPRNQSFSWEFRGYPWEQLAGESSVDLYAVSVPAVCRYCPHRGNRPNCNRCSQQP